MFVSTSWDGSKWIIESCDSKAATSPLDIFLQEIESALRARLFYLAVTVTLTIPDLCAALEASDGRTNSALYKAWYDRHLASLTQMSSDECYSLRCGVVHQGRMHIAGQSLQRVLFYLPNRPGFSMHDNLLPSNAGSALQLDAVTFCKDVISATRKWWDLAKENPVVQANIPDLVVLRPNGLKPWLVGVPLIA